MTCDADCARHTVCLHAITSTICCLLRYANFDHLFPDPKMCFPALPAFSPQQTPIQNPTANCPQHGALPLNFAHDPDFFKLLRAVRWYGAASVPQGNNPNSSRYVSTYTPPPPAADAAAAAAVATASCDAGTSAAAGVSSVAAAKRAEKTSSGGASGWIKAHIPHIRSRAAAVAAAAAQPGSSALATPESLAVAAVGSAASAAAAGRRSSSRSVSPAGSAVSSESAAAQAAAASLAREAVKAVVARAAAEAAAEESSGCERQGVVAAGVGPAVKAREPAVSPVGSRGAAPVTPVEGPSPGGC
jgi:hypothetical protein